MAIRQLSVFAENKPGALTGVTSALAEAGVDLRAMSVADTQDYGILRMIVSDTDLAAETLKRKQYLCSVTEVLAAEVPDEPGGLFRVLIPLGNEDVNLEYLYAFVTGSGKSACVVLRVADCCRAAEVLEASGIKLLEEADIARF